MGESIWSEVDGYRLFFPLINITERAIKKEKGSIRKPPFPKLTKQLTKLMKKNLDAKICYGALKAKLWMLKFCKKIEFDIEDVTFIESQLALVWWILIYLGSEVILHGMINLV